MGISNNSNNVIFNNEWGFLIIAITSFSIMNGISNNSNNVIFNNEWFLIIATTSFSIMNRDF